MTILILSPDEEAAMLLCSALVRNRQPALWHTSPQVARDLVEAEPPLVLVADADEPAHVDLCRGVRHRAPWARTFVMARRGNVPSRPAAPILLKPFDAAEIAAFLGGERARAEVDRQRLSFEVRTEELALLVEASFEAIVGLGADGVVRSWNPAAQAIYGFASASVARGAARPAPGGVARRTW